MIKFSKQFKDFKRRKQDIVKHFDKKGYSPENVSEYCSIVSIPLYIVYYILYTEYQIQDALDNCLRLCEFYQVDFDIKE